MTSSSTVWVRALRARLITEHGGKCQASQLNLGGNHDGELEFAHIKNTEVTGIGRGSYARAVDVRDHPNSYLLLCRKHHLQYDTGQPIFSGHKWQSQEFFMQETTADKRAQEAEEQEEPWM